MADTAGRLLTEAAPGATGIALDTLNALILQIYRAARETPVDEYQDFVLGLVRGLVPFTSSRWLTVEMVGQRAITHCVHLQNEPTDIVVDWDAINRQDRLLHTVVAHPGKAFGIHSDSVYTGRQFAEMRDYVRRYNHANTLCIAVPATKPGHVHGLSLFRAGQDDQYSDANRHLLECLMPHLIEALAQNRLLALRQAGSSELAPEQGSAAIARGTGEIHFAGSGFNRLLQQEWPDWQGNRLPAALLDALCRGGGYAGEQVSVAATRLNALLFLRAAPRCPLTRLTPRESATARLYGQGLSHKEIAKRLDISPATVRNFIGRIYCKLKVGDKAELSALLSRSGQIM